MVGQRCGELSGKPSAAACEVPAEYECGFVTFALMFVILSFAETNAEDAEEDAIRHANLAYLTALFRFRVCGGHESVAQAQPKKWSR